jgi:hypothetical protein
MPFSLGWYILGVGTVVGALATGWADEGAAGRPFGTVAGAANGRCSSGEPPGKPGAAGCTGAFG